MGKKARPQLRDLLENSKAPAVRIAVMQGLSDQWDYGDEKDNYRTMSMLLDALSDKDPLVRQGAYLAVRNLLSKGFDYRATDPPEKRAEAINKMRDLWENFRKDILPSWQEKLANKKSRT